LSSLQTHRRSSVSDWFCKTETKTETKPGVALTRTLLATRRKKTLAVTVCIVMVAVAVQRQPQITQNFRKGLPIQGVVLARGNGGEAPEDKTDPSNSLGQPSIHM
jgi:hypothetical protein